MLSVIDTARVFVSPIVVSTGINTKNVLALSRGIPLVTTTAGAAGMCDQCDHLKSISNTQFKSVLHSKKLGKSMVIKREPMLRYTNSNKYNSNYNANSNGSGSGSGAQLKTRYDMSDNIPFVVRYGVVYRVMGYVCI